MTSILAGVLFSLSATLSWGSADFAGGFASRRANPYQVLVVAGIASLLALIPTAIYVGERLPTTAAVLWTITGGAAGTFGIATLYRALAQGSAAVISPTAAVIGASLPVLVSVFTEGVPIPSRLAGIALGVLGIWLVSRVEQTDRHIQRGDLTMAVLAGLGFAGFFICLGQVPAGSIFYPSILVKMVSITVSLLYLGNQKLPALPKEVMLCAGIGLLDTFGNVMYMFARQHSRMDVAVVLSSMYPAVTVILAWAIQRQPVLRVQWAGIVLCLAAVALIAI